MAVEHWRRVEWTSTEDFFGRPIVMVHTRLVDHRDLEVSEDRVHRAYRELSAVGYCVKLRREYLGNHYPSTGYVASVNSDMVVVRAHATEGFFSGTKADFHRLYEVD